MSSSITTQRIRHIHAALAHRGLMAEKKELVRQFTNGRATSTKDMTASELTAMLQHLNGGTVPAPREGDRQRKYIISMAHEMGWKLPGGKADMQRIDQWCMKYGHLHAPLNDHLGADLAKLVTTFKKVYDNYLDQLSKR